MKLLWCLARMSDQFVVSSQTESFYQAFFSWLILFLEASFPNNLLLLKLMIGKGTYLANTVIQENWKATYKSNKSPFWSFHLKREIWKFVWYHSLLPKFSPNNHACGSTIHFHWYLFRNSKWLLFSACLDVHKWYWYEYGPERLPRLPPSRYLCSPQPKFAQQLSSFRWGILWLSKVRKNKKVKVKNSANPDKWKWPFLWRDSFVVLFWFPHGKSWMTIPPPRVGTLPSREIALKLLLAFEILQSLCQTMNKWAVVAVLWICAFLQLNAAPFTFSELFLWSSRRRTRLLVTPWCIRGMS